ncbi:MAG: IPT/TIG domain-containing protein, partial [Solirubrobacteraceae bacterium]|nr:IPT/TIG domain-containing protein [Solirubrobacteraceae bacterium]
MTRTRPFRAIACLLAVLALSASAVAPANAAPTYRASATANGTINWGGGSATVARPAGTANTDLLIATIRASATWNVTDVQWATSHGWTLLQDNGDAGKTYYRQAGASANYTLLSWGSATFPLENWVASISAFSGVDLAAPIVGSGTAATGSGSSAALPNDTADRDGSMRFTATTINGTNATTFSAGMTKVVGGEVGASSMGISGAWELQDTGTTPARTASWSASRSWIAHTAIIRGSESAPTVTDVSPDQGPTAGGTSVTITGTNFSSTTAVSFGGTNAPGFTVNSPTQITVAAPARAAGTVAVRVTNSGGQSADTAADDYTYVAAPTVTGLAPTSGPAPGGTSVTITGTNLTAASAVTFGGVNATGYTVDSPTQITATAPAGSGTVDVRVTTAGGQSANTAADNFTYIPAPAITSIAPSTGPESGGTVVVITGTNFTGASQVQFGATNATGYTVNSATQITATAPAATGVQNVRVTTPSGTSPNTAADDFTFVALPTVTGLSPGQGPTAGGTSVTITGTNFTGVSAVTFGGVNATGYTVDSATQITATAPAGAAGTADVRVTATGGQSANTAADDYAYIAAPTVTGLSPATGPPAGGTSVTITGTNLTAASAVTFGGVNATGYTVDSATQI